MGGVLSRRAPFNFTTYAEAVPVALELFQDLSFAWAREWKQADASRRIIGFLPIYVPREVIHAAGMLPVGIFGAGDRIPVVKGDAFFQSYICHLPRTVVELALNGNLDDFDGFLFPSICDVIRNLSGIFRLKFPRRFVRYLDFPQNFNPSTGGQFYRAELDRLQADLARLNGRRVSISDLNHSIAQYNKNRRLLHQLAEFRLDAPEKIPAVDYYLIRRAGFTMAVEDYNDYLEAVMALAEKLDTAKEDKIRIVVSGSFCEQPPLGLIKTIENAGCYIVDDDFQLGLKWFCRDIPEDTGDPIGALVDGYLSQSTSSSAVFDRENAKGERLAEAVRNCKADGVIFCAPSFCDPALLDRPMLESAMNRHHIRHTSFQYHENLGQFRVIKEQAGTFADMIKLWE
jgi:benzoyl-CoA reductase subunit C